MLDPEPGPPLPPPPPPPPEPHLPPKSSFSFLVVVATACGEYWNVMRRGWKIQLVRLYTKKGPKEGSEEEENCEHGIQN
jgi:hypothetical protein